MKEWAKALTPMVLAFAGWMAMWWAFVEGTT